MASLTVKLYRFVQEGRAKDWALPCEVQSTDAELTVYFGATGKALRQAVTPARRCVNGDPAAEARKREREKLGKGYRYLGVYALNLANRRELTALTDIEPEITPPCLYWERQSATGSTEPLSDAALDALYRLSDRCLQRLLTAGLIRFRDVHWEGRGQGRWAFHIQNRDQHWWRFGFDWGLTDKTPPPDAHRLHLRGHGRGMISLTHEHTAEVAFFLLLRQADPALGLADETGCLVTSWPEELAIDPATLVALGLTPTNAEVLLAAIDTGDNGWFY